MSEYDNYDQDLTQMRMAIGKENSDWYKYFKIRDHYIKLMLVSFLIVWSILSTLAIILQLNSLFIFLVPNLAWIFVCLPYFIYKIAQVSKMVNAKKEEVVVTLWTTKTQSIKEIMLRTGLERNFIEYYLKKNGLGKKSIVPVEDQ